MFIQNHLANSNAMQQKERLLYAKKKKRKRCIRKILYALLSSTSEHIVGVCIFGAICSMLFLTSADYIDENSLYDYSPVHAPVISAAYGTRQSPVPTKMKVTIELEKKDPLVCSTNSITVSELLATLHLSLSPQNVMNYAPDEPVTPEMQIRIDKVETKEFTIQEEIPYATEKISLQTVPKGTRQVLQTGVAGSRKRTVKQLFRNGDLESETILKEDVLQPQAEIIKEGVGGTFTAPDGSIHSYSYYMDVSATAYGDGTDGSDGPGKTAIGTAVRKGVIAVDPRYIPLRTKVYVTGNYGDYGVCYAEDVGGGIKGTHIDIYLGSNENVIRNFGRRKMRVYILD